MSRLATWKNKGFSAIEAVIIVVVLALVGGLGYVWYSNSNANEKEQASNDAAQSTEIPSANTEVPSAPKIDSLDDLDKAEQLLNQSDVDSQDDLSRLNGYIGEIK